MNQNDMETPVPGNDAATPAAVVTEDTKKKRRLHFRVPHFNGMDGESNALCYLTAFLLPFIIMLGVYAALSKHPFGDGSVLTLDLQGQYVYYYEALRRLLTEGGSWLYSFERTLGGEFMGIVAYYAASPFNILFALFPKNMMADAVMFVQLFKVGAMGLAFAYYLKKTRKTEDMLTVSFALMYALSAYSVVQLMNPMWLDAMVFLPLLVLGIEAMIRQRRFILYTASLVTIFVTNYYIGYMCAIFTFAYYLYYYFLVRDELSQNPGAERGNAVKRLFCSRGFETLMRFGVFSVLAAVISAFMLWSAWHSLSFGKTDFSNPDFGFSFRFDFLDIFVKLLPGSYDTVRPNGLPMIYSGMLALIAAPLFFLSRTITTKKKALTAMLLVFFVISFSVNTVDLVWHGFSAPNWLNYRYSFLFSFVFIVMACDAIRGLSKITFREIATVGTAIFALVLIVQKLGYTFEQTADRNNDLDDAKCILISLVLIAIYVFLLRILQYKNMQKSGAVALAAIVCVEMFASSLITVGEVQIDVGTVRYDNYLSADGKTENYSGYHGSIRRIENVVNEILERDTSLYRMESTVYRREGGVNEPMAFGFNGISHSTSTLNADVIKFMNVLGYSSMSHWTKYIGGTPISDALLGIKYVVTKNDTLDPNFYTVAAKGPEQYKFIPTENTIYAMQNTKALSLVYGVSPDLAVTLSDFNQPPYRSALDMQNELLNAMLSGVGSTPNAIRGIYAAPFAENCRHTYYSHSHDYIDENGEKQYAPTKYHVFTPDEGKTEATIRYSFEAKADGPLYFHVAGVTFSGMSTDCQIKVNGSRVCNYFTNETWTIQKLGTFEKGEEIEVEIVFKNGILYFARESDYMFYYMDQSAVNDALSQLEYASMDVTEHGNDYLKGTIDLPEGQELIFTTIPYDEGWKVTIDGAEVEPIKVLGTLMAVPSTAGLHEIEFIYRPDSFVYGGLLSILGIVIFALLIVWSKLWVKGKRVLENGSRVHFFFHKGDEDEGWKLEMAEVESLSVEAVQSDAVPGATAISEAADADTAENEQASPAEDTN